MNVVGSLDPIPGEGHILILPVNYSAIVQGTWVIPAGAVQGAPKIFINTTQAINDEVNYLLFLAVGAYIGRMIYRTDVGYGRLFARIETATPFINGLEGYSAVLADDNALTTDPFTITVSRLYTMRVYSNTKHASSTGYGMGITSLGLWRTS